MTRPWDLFPFSQVAQAVRTVWPLTDANLTLAERPDRILSMWEPMDRLLEHLHATGEVDERQGRVVFVAEGENPQEVVPVLRGIFDLYELAQIRHQVVVDLGPLKRLCNKFDYGAPISEEELVKSQACIEHCKAAIAKITVQQAISLAKDTRIRAALEHQLYELQKAA